MASVAINGKPLAPDVLVDESWFLDPVFCEKSKLWYMLSKTLDEEAAWNVEEVLKPLKGDTFPNKAH
ncbi:unnamed protein product, partial [Vitis vinifera]